MGTKTETAVAKKASKTPVKSTTATKAKSVKVPKLKKLADPTKARSHPPYIEMVEEAILALKERTGSSQYAIAKYIEEKQKENLPPNFKKLLLVQLRRHVASGKLTKIKNSFKLSATVKSVKTVKPVKQVKKLPVKAKVATPLKAKKAVVKVKAVVKKVLTEKKTVKKVVSKPKKSPAKALKKPKSLKSPAKKSAVKKAKK